MNQLTPNVLRLALQQIIREKDVVALRNWIRLQTDIILPSDSFTPGHSSPMAFVADAVFNPSQDVAAWACRSGGKTLGASILALIQYTATDGLKGRVLSGSLDQAKNLYKYWEQWCDGALKWRIKGDVNRQITRVAGGELEILTASPKSVRGPKIQLLLEDELDEIDAELDDTAAGMIATFNGIPARTIYTSTWHRANGTMGRLIEKSQLPLSDGGNDVRLHLWNLWEAIQRCPDERHQNGRGCQECPLGASCVERARQHHSEPLRRLGIAAEANGLYSIKDAIKAATKVSQGMWDSEYLCLRPSIEGMVYPTFDRRMHVKAGLDFAQGEPVYRAIDFGLNLFCCLWIQEGKQGQVYVVDEMWAENATVSANGRAILAKDNVFPPPKIAATFVDPAGRNRNDQTGHSSVDELRALGIPCRYKTDSWSREVLNGIQVIRGVLKPALGRPRLFISATCTMLLKAFESYRNRKVNGEYIDDPVKPQPLDHGLDALRYYFVNRHSRSQDFFGTARNA